jgi:hypothetical protein
LFFQKLLVFQDQILSLIKISKAARIVTKGFLKAACSQMKGSVSPSELSGVSIGISR